MERIEVANFTCKLYKDECSSYGSKISNALIKIASTRIFAEPEQSIMELPVNSVDSYNLLEAKKSIGKFGMGIFSLFYWLDGHPKRSITIESKIKNQPGFKIRLSFDNDLKIQHEEFKYIKNINLEEITNAYKNSKNSSLFKTSDQGTEITLDFRNDPLSEENIKNIEKHLARLFMVKNVNIFYTYNKSSDIVYPINSCIYDKNVLISSGRLLFKVLDNAGGIPLDLLYNALLVPSSSSKTRSFKTKEYLTYDVLIEERQLFQTGGLYIFVNGISIVNIPGNSIMCYCVNLPSYAQLPVARDDIIYDYEEISIFESQINSILDLLDDVTDLLEILDKYCTINTQLLLFNSILQIKKRLNSGIFILDNDIFREISYMFPDVRFIIHPYPEMYKTEMAISALLDPISQTDIFKGKKVVFLDLDISSETCGLSSYIFVGNDYVKNNPNWKINLITKSDNMLLIPYESKIDEGTIEYVSKIKYRIVNDILLNNPDFLDNFDRIYKETYDSFISNPILVEACKNLKLTLLGKTQNINFDINLFMLQYIIYFYMINENIEEVLQYINTLNYVFSMKSFIFPYGEERKIIGLKLFSQFESFGYIFENGILATKIEKKLKKINNQKFNNFIDSISPYNFPYETKYILNEFEEIIEFIPDDQLDEIQEYLYQILDYSKFDNQSYTYIYGMETKLKQSISKILFYFVNNLFCMDYYVYPYVGDLDNLYQFVRFTSKEYQHEILTALNEAINAPELFTILYCMLNFYSDYFVNDTHRNIQFLGEFCIREIRRNISTTQIDYLHKKMINGDERDFIAKILLPLYGALKTYVDVMNKSVVIYDDLDLTIQEYIFSTKSLIKYIFQNEPNEDFDELLKILNEDYKTFKLEDSKLQIVEIAVNEGTTKNFIESILTEILQNSIDAIRITNSSDEILTMIDDNSIRVVDFVGINNKNAFLSLMIPFLSTKSDEIGSGFFNVFRQPYSKKMIFHTTYSGQTTQITGTPLVKNGQVYDIEYRIKRYESEEENSTIVTIKIIDDFDLKVRAIAEAKIFIENFEGLIPGIRLNCMNDNYDIIYENEFGYAMISRNKFTKSYVLINSVPFMPFLEFSEQIADLFKEMINNSGTQLIINLNKDFYVLNQSRNKIRIFPEFKEEFSKFVNDSMYYLALYKYKNKIDNSLIYNTLSQMEISQVLPVKTENVVNSYSDKDVKYFNLFTDYSPNGELTISEKIWEIYEKIQRNESYELEDNIRDECIVRWLSNKNLYEEKLEKENENIPKFSEVLTKFTKIYWNIIQDLCEEGIIKRINSNGSMKYYVNDEYPNIYFYHFTDGSAFYRRSDHNIYINNEYYKDEEISQKLYEYKNMYMENKEDTIIKLRIDELVKKYFNPCIPATILIHELGHAIQGSDHKGSSHGLTEIGIKNEPLLFDVMACEIYKLAIDRNLFGMFFESL